MAQLEWLVWHWQRLSQQLRLKANARLSKVFWPQPHQANMVMFHLGRSGSTVLTDLLAQHPQVFWDGEIYEELFRQLERKGQASQAGHLPVDPMELLGQRMNRTGQAFYGFEVKFFHLKLLGMTLQNFVERLHDLGFVYLVLERKNYLRKIVSSLVARQTSRYHRPPRVKRSLTQIKLDLDHISIDRATRPLITCLQDYAESFGVLKTLLAGQHVLWLTYEDDILADPWRGYQRACQFLNLQPLPARLHYGKTNPFTLNELVTNFQELECYLRGTSFEWMLSN